MRIAGGGGRSSPRALPSPFPLCAEAPPHSPRANRRRRAPQATVARPSVANGKDLGALLGPGVAKHSWGAPMAKWRIRSADLATGEESQRRGCRFQKLRSKDALFSTSVPWS